MVWFFPKTHVTVYEKYQCHYTSCCNFIQVPNSNFQRPRTVQVGSSTQSETVIIRSLKHWNISKGFALQTLKNASPSWKNPQKSFSWNEKNQKVAQERKIPQKGPLGLENLSQLKLSNFQKKTRKFLKKSLTVPKESKWSPNGLKVCSVYKMKIAVVVRFVVYKNSKSIHFKASWHKNHPLGKNAD